MPLAPPFCQTDSKRQATRQSSNAPESWRSYDILASVVRPTPWEYVECRSRHRNNTTTPQRNNATLETVKRRNNTTTQPQQLRRQRLRRLQRQRLRPQQPQTKAALEVIEAIEVRSLTSQCATVACHSAAVGHGPTDGWMDTSFSSKIFTLS